MDNQEEQNSNELIIETTVQNENNIEEIENSQEHNSDPGSKRLFKKLKTVASKIMEKKNKKN